jgi:hypothetical protein
MRLVFGTGIIVGTIGCRPFLYKVFLIGNLGVVAAYLGKNHGAVAQVFLKCVLALDAFVA